MGKSVGSVFSNANDQVNGLTDTVSQAKQDGLSNSDIAQLGTTASPGVRAARIGAKVALGGLSGLSNVPQRAGNTGYGGMINPSPTPSQPQAAPDLSYLADARNRFNPMYGS